MRRKRPTAATVPAPVETIGRDRSTLETHLDLLTRARYAITGARYQMPSCHTTDCPCAECGVCRDISAELKKWQRA